MKTNLFASLGISEEIVEALSNQGYTEPTPIQQESIPVVLAGEDVIAQAQTGTGKTLAFVLPILERIDPKKNFTQALIVTPTRELAIQIAGEVQKWAPVKGVRVLAAYGGQDVERQLKKLEGTVHMIIATPGRLLDHLRRETVQLQRLSTLVLDEADQMLHMGFLKEVEEIIVQTSPKRQTLLFSATMPGPIRNLAKSYMRDPQEIKVKTKQVTLTEIEQIAIKTTDRGKQDALVRLIDEYQPYLAMIFCRTKLRASKLNEALQDLGYASDELHGDLTQAKREQVMKRFREAKIQLLVATDIAARGLDVEGITHVFNYDMPHDVEGYIHRIGRTGRAGQRGMAITMVAQRDQGTLEAIERGINAELPRRTVKADGELSEARTSGPRKGSEREESGRGRTAEPRRGERRGGSRQVKASGGRGRGDRAQSAGREQRDWNAGGERSGQQARGRGDRAQSAGREQRDWNAGGERSGQQARGRGDRAQTAGREQRDWNAGGERSGQQARGRGDRAQTAGREQRDWNAGGERGGQQARGRGDRAQSAGREQRDWNAGGERGGQQARGRGDRAQTAGREQRDWNASGERGGQHTRGRGERAQSAGGAQRSWNAGNDRAGQQARGRGDKQRSGQSSSSPRTGRNDTSARGRRGR